MVQAAAMISREPIALQLRFLQTMREISSEHNTHHVPPGPDRSLQPVHQRTYAEGLPTESLITR